MRAARRVSPRSHRAHATAWPIRLAAAAALTFSLTGCGFVFETLVTQVVDPQASRSPLGPTGPGDPSGLTGRENPPGPAPGAPFGLSVLGMSWLSRVVGEKRFPLTLVARDGATCQVSEWRFEHIRLGQRIVCLWTSDGSSPGLVGPWPIGPRY